MILAISVLYLLWTVESFISQSTPFLHIQHHRTVKGISSKFSPRAKLSDEENKDRIKTALNKVGDEVTKNKGIKDINIDLVSRGQKFDSYRRRFDYYSLVASDENWLANVDSVWIRDNSRNVNVDEFLIATKGLSTEEAKLESKKLHSQSYCQEILSESGDATKEGMKTLGPTSCMKFKVTTLQGIPTIDDEGNNQQHGYERRVSWEGNAYIEELFDRNTNQKILKIEKTLIFDYDNIGNSMIMKVNSTLYSEKNSNEKCTITCQQYLNAAFNLESNNAQVDNLVNHNVLRSKMNRVPGCVSNVNVCTTLIPIKKYNDESEPTYKVFVDGETDTLLSRGLLSVLSSVLSSLESKDILQIDAFTITEELNLRKVLSAGRNDGLSNMITIIQNQISEIIENQEKGISENMNNVDAVNNELERRPTVAMLLSGGVDSAVALNLLRRQNYNVTAFYLKIWLEDELSHLGQCPWEDDYNVCVDVCKHAGDIPLEAISLQEAYKERVISYTIGEAKKGRTPNPDIMCNSRIKFGCFYDEIANRGFDYVASGHYAQLQRVSDDGEMKLFRAPDPVKDQSYFLAALRQDQLMRVLFPIGHLQKPEVRSLAEEFDLPNKSRPDSQGNFFSVQRFVKSTMQCFANKYSFIHC
jgi:sulfur transfer protein SufE